MKNREEYQASIFAKKDALLAKRRRRISQSVAVLSIAACFAAAFAFLPKSLDYKVSFSESYAESATFVSDSLTAAAPTTQESTVLQEPDEAYTFYSSYIKYLGTKPHSQKSAAAEASPAIEEFIQTATQIHLPNQDKQFAHKSEETTRRGYGGFRPEMWDDDGLYITEVHAKPEGAPDYTSEEIAKKAETYLSDDIAGKIIDKHTLVTVRHFATPPDYYVVWFYTDNKQIKVTLNSENLELIETEETSLSDETETKTTPAYIPTTAKSPMTTAAPAYMPQ